MTTWDDGGSGDAWNDGDTGLENTTNGAALRHGDDAGNGNDRGGNSGEFGACYNCGEDG